MPVQIELFRRPGLRMQAIFPEPRLWISRLVIWSEPGQVLRDIPLRRGINILWSPDRLDREGFDLGHGAGKSLFCRLIRYCLGEESLGSMDVEERLKNAFKDGRVGIEARLCGRLWSVQRSLGPIPADLAAPDLGLELMLHEGGGSFSEWTQALQASVIPGELLPLMPEKEGLFPWLYALAWMSRDQECRFAGLMDWRAAASGSHSPVRHSSAAMRLEALRVLGGMIGVEEHRLERALEQRGEEKKRAELQVEELGRDRSRLRRRIAEGLGLPVEGLMEGPLAVEWLRRQVAERRQPELQLEEAPSFLDLSQKTIEARSRRDSLARRVEGLQKQLAAARQDLENGRKDLHFAESPVCPLDGARLDRVHAEGCLLAMGKKDKIKLLDPEIAAERVQQAEQERASLQQRLTTEEQKLEEAEQRLSEAEEEEKKAKESFEKQRAHGRDQRERWFIGRRLEEQVEELGQLQDQLDQARRSLLFLEEQQEELKEAQARCRGQQLDAFSRLSRRFDQLIQAIAGRLASGELRLDGRGLSASVQAGGERSSVAMESLKVLAFDLAMMIGAAEGEGSLPAFLIHDSPREADLSMMLYHRLFRVVEALEGEEEAAFQYIVTTTTEPPVEYQKAPWLVLKLSGSEAEGRLFGRDL